MKSRVVTAAALTVVALIAGAAPALAAGSDKQVITLTCGQSSYEATIWGNGEWTPARDNASSIVFHPTYFGEATHTFYPSDGSAPVSRTSPAKEFKTQPSTTNPTFSCTFRAEFVASDGTYVDEGPVDGYMSGAAKH
ncbi:MAG: hypothetical protein LC750_03740 [Actinobacteria bacterium]|nr:hypothetical protein [Actinomycetota bacterium]